MSTSVISLSQFTQSKLKFTDYQAPTIKYCNTEIKHLKKKPIALALQTLQEKL